MLPPASTQEAFRVYPVLDLQGGVVVHGKGGERSSYRPLRSSWADSSDPLDLAGMYRERFGLTEVYVADLDAIAGRGVSSTILRDLLAAGFRLLVDTGTRALSELEEVLALGIHGIVAPLETLPNAALLGRMVGLCGVRRLVFSLDFKGGRRLGNDSWPTALEDLAAVAYNAGVRRMLVLDLKRVGSRAGPAHLDVIPSLRRAFPDVEWLIGGGVRSVSDLRMLRDAGASGALMATALHDGSIRSARELLFL